MAAQSLGAELTERASVSHYLNTAHQPRLGICSPVIAITAKYSDINGDSYFSRFHFQLIQTINVSYTY
jgi:hypothetical protein